MTPPPLRRLVTLLLLAALAAAHASALPAHPDPDVGVHPPERDLGWVDMPSVPGLPVLHLSYAVEGLGVSKFEIFSVPVPGGQVETRWLFPDVPAVHPATFDAGSRLLVGSPGVHAFHWVGREDVLGGSARLGHEETSYLGLAPTGHVFAGAASTYVFSSTGGYLVAARDHASGTAIVLTGVSLQASMPPLLVVDPVTEVQWKPLAASVTPGEGSPGERTVLCGGTIDGVFGRALQTAPAPSPFPAESPDCEEAFSTTGEVRVTGASFTFPRLSTGVVDGTLHGPAGLAYYWGKCVAEQPDLDPPLLDDRLGLAKDCTDGPLGGERGPGLHRLEGAASFRHCLDPLLYFQCPWAVSFRFVET